MPSGENIKTYGRWGIKSVLIRICGPTDLRAYAYYVIKNSASLNYFDICFMLNIEGVFDRRRHDSLSK